MKICILGYSGSGKSTLARRLGDFYGIPVLFLDTVQFLPGWLERDRDEARALVREFLQNGSWVIDGNYRAFLQEERLRQADRILILQFNRFVCLWQAFRRYRRYKNTVRESMADGCCEKLDAEFIRWLLLDGRTRARRAHLRHIAAQYPSKTLVFKNRRAVNAFTRALSAPGTEAAGRSETNRK